MPPQIGPALASALAKPGPTNAKAALPDLVQTLHDAVRYAAQKMREAGEIEDPTARTQALKDAQKELADTYKHVSGVLEHVDADTKDKIDEKIIDSLNEFSLVMLSTGVSPESIALLERYAEDVFKVVPQPS